MKNLQGDILKVYTESGEKAVEYKYDAWGKLLSTTASGAYSHMSGVNRLLYRGYYYDSETEYYYLNSRYYDPQVKRFISSDNVNYLGANDDMSAFNLYAYCSNNPVMYVDYYGNASEFWNKFEESNKKSILAKIALCIVGIYYLSEETDIKAFDDLSEDINNFSLHNSDEQKVIKANIFSAYNGALVIKSNLLENNAFSFGIMVIGKGDKISINDIKHEYGHAIQFAMLGRSKYWTDVAIPSVTINCLDRLGKLPYSYYGAPFERQADLLGKVTRNKDNAPWPNNVYNNYFDLIEFFW